MTPCFQTFHHHFTESGIICLSNNFWKMYNKGSASIVGAAFSVCGCILSIPGELHVRIKWTFLSTVAVINVTWVIPSIGMIWLINSTAKRSTEESERIVSVKGSLLLWCTVSLRLQFHMVVYRTSPYSYHCYAFIIAFCCWNWCITVLVLGHVINPCFGTRVSSVCMPRCIFTDAQLRVLLLITESVLVRQVGLVSDTVSVRSLRLPASCVHALSGDPLSRTPK